MVSLLANRHAKPFTTSNLIHGSHFCFLLSHTSLVKRDTTLPTATGGAESEDANDDVRVDDCSLHDVHHVSGWYSTI